MRNRQRVLVGLLVAAGLLTLLLLWDVIATVFFAVTVAYVLYPVRRRLVARGIGRRIAAGLCTALAFLAVVVLVVPLVWALYERRTDFIAFLRALPDVFELEFLGVDVALDVAAVAAGIREIVTDVAVDLAGAAPILALKVFLFALLVYALLLRPTAAQTVAYRTVPDQYHDVVRRLHERVRDTLYAIYVLQGATAFATFLVGYVVFAGLGYESPFVLAALSGVLQFVPVVGPSVVVGAVALGDFMAGDTTGAVTVAVVGAVFVGFLPDAIVRPQLAPYTARIPGSLYFIGFTGGVLSVGLVGFIAGPLVVALLVEVVDMVADERDPRRESLG